MKLLLCPVCQDVKKLDLEMRSCKCGRCAGRYIDDLQAEVYGKNTIVLGLHNPTLANAIRKPDQVGKGNVFTAFTIPQDCATVERHMCKYDGVKDTDKGVSTED